jgi:hypothetical protein
MPLNDAQFEAFSRWLRSRAENRTRLDFIWDALTAGQRTGLVAQVKSDLNNEFDATVAAIQERQTDVTGNI